ncbi:hypothetical protein [uncultured Roseivirga sp.]|uniref:hypothetical protein n=1 Tax=uncultured Roseivirga sp. TaxID=543088 RepID=UPI0030D7D135
MLLATTGFQISDLAPLSVYQDWMVLAKLAYRSIDGPHQTVLSMTDRLFRSALSKPS